MNMQRTVLVLIAVTVFASFTLTGTAYAQESSGSDNGFKFLSAGLAFGLAALGAGIGLAYVGSAGLAVISENPALAKVFNLLEWLNLSPYMASSWFIILGNRRLTFDRTIPSFCSKNAKV